MLGDLLCLSKKGGWKERWVCLFLNGSIHESEWNEWAIQGVSYSILANL